jgi:hypothetical protein
MVNIYNLLIFHNVVSPRFEAIYGPFLTSNLKEKLRSSRNIIEYGVESGI